MKENPNLPNTMQMYVNSCPPSFLSVTRRGESLHQAVGKTSVQDIQ